MSYIVSKRLCPQNHRCPIIRVCPAGAIIQSGYGLPIIDKSKCTECGKCAKYCPTRAVSKE
jgi:Fe-S-cluster-containing hydrogenase component 2